MGVKLLVLIGLLFNSCESLQVPVTCDGVHQYFPDPLDCGKFYECNSSPEATPEHMTCPSGLHWNAQINACDWPAHANCQLSGFCCYGCGGVCSAELVSGPDECSGTCDIQHCAPWCGNAAPAKCSGSNRPPSAECCDVTGECHPSCPYNCPAAGYCCYNCFGVCSTELVEDPADCSSTCNPQQCAPWCGTAGPAECAGSERPPSHQCCDVTGECTDVCPQNC